MEELIFMDASNKILNNQFAQLPSVDYVIQHHSLISFQKEYGLSELTKVTRLILSEVRNSFMSD